jgi:hypothetical protein
VDRYCSRYYYGRRRGLTDYFPQCQMKQADAGRRRRRRRRK